MEKWQQNYVPYADEKQLLKDIEGSSPRPNRKRSSRNSASIEEATASSSHEPTHSDKSNNGILAKNDPIPEENSKREKWQQNYVPCSELDNMPKRSIQSVNGSTPVMTERIMTPDESDATMVRKVSEIFEEVFKIPRGQWSLKIQYFLACLGAPIACSSLWRFPILITKYGGGAFLISYVILMVLVGIPFYFMESAIGQFSQLSCVHIWRCAPLMKGIGIAMVILSLLTSLYNSQIITYAVHYFFASFVNTDRKSVV